MVINYDMTLFAMYWMFGHNELRFGGLCYVMWYVYVYICDGTIWIL